MRVISVKVGMVLVGAALTLALACGDSGTNGGANCLTADGGAQPEDAGQDAGVIADAGTDAGTDGGQQAVIPALCTNPQAGVPQLTDGDILQILITANEGEVAQGQLAQMQATDPDTKAFAADMVTEHTAALQRLQAIATQQGITPTDNPASAQLRAKTIQNTSIFSEQTGNSFDEGYMDAQLSEHANVAFLSDMMLVPQVKNVDLKNELQAERITIQNHLERALPIQTALFAKP